MSQKILNKDLKVFVIWWLLLAVVSWFGPLVFVLDILGQHQDLEAWQIVLVLASFLMLAGQYFMLRLWFRRSGLGTPAIYLPLHSRKWVAAAFWMEFFVFISLDNTLGNGILGGNISFFGPYYVMWPMIAVLLFWRPKMDFPPTSWVIVLISIIVGLLGHSGDFFELPDSLIRVIRPLPNPMVWLVSLGFLAACVKGALLFVGFQLWRAGLKMEESTKQSQRRRKIALSMLGLVIFFTLLNFAFPLRGPQVVGLQPCGWLDIHLNRSHCMQSWYLGWDMDSPTLSSDGAWLAIYDEVLKEVQIRSVESGEMTARRSVEEFINAKYYFPELFFSPDGSLLLLSESDSGALLWDIAQDRLTPVASTAEASYFGTPVFSSDGGELAFAVDGNLVIWDVQNYQTINRIPLTGNQFQFAGDQKAILIRTDEQVLHWEYLLSREPVKVAEVKQTETDFFSRDFYDVEGQLYTVIEIKDQFYLTYDEDFFQLPLAGTEVADFVVDLEISISPNGKYLAFAEDNWLSVHRTTDGAVFFWANPCGRDDSCYIRDLEVNDEGLVLLYPSGNIQIWSVER